MLSTCSRLTALVLAALTQAGCEAYIAQHSKTVPVGYALANLERDIAETAAITLSDFATPDKQRVSDAIVYQQCKQRTSNPLLPFVSGAFSVQLQGQFQLGPEAKAIGSKDPSLEIDISAQRQQQQQLTFSINFVPLKDLPTYRFGQLMTQMTNLDDDNKKKEATSLLGDRKDIQDVVDKLVADFKDVNDCDARKDRMLATLAARRQERVDELKRLKKNGLPVELATMPVFLRDPSSMHKAINPILLQEVQPQN